MSLMKPADAKVGSVEFELLVASGYHGVASIECEGAGGPLIKRSVAWAGSQLEGVQA